MKAFARLLLVLCLPFVLGGCDKIVNMVTGADKIAAKEAEGKAVGAGCRQVGRSLETCYGSNPKLPKAAIFTGWMDMNDYMQTNKMEVASDGGKPPSPPEEKH